MTPLSPTCLPGRGVVAVTGPDATEFLQGLVTANVARLDEGEVTHAALLTPQGKVLSAFFAWAAADGMLLDTAPGDAPALMRRLALYKLRAKVEIADASDRLASFAGDEGPAGARPDPRCPAMGARWLAAPEGGEDAAYQARRIALGVPEFAADYGPNEAFPMDVNLDALGAVDYKKGCFVGQEVASRMYRKGSVRKRSWRAHADADLDVGTDIVAGGSTLGTVTSADGASGIALVRVDRIAAADGTPEAGGVPVRLAPPDYLP